MIYQLNLIYFLSIEFWFTGTQRYKPKSASHQFSNRRFNMSIESSNSTKISQTPRRNSSSALLNSSASLRSSGIVGHTKSIVSRPVRKKRRAKSAIGSYNFFSNPSKVAVHNRPWKWFCPKWFIIWNKCWIQYQHTLIRMLTFNRIYLSITSV